MVQQRHSRFRRRGVSKVEALLGAGVLALVLGGLGLYSNSSDSSERDQEAVTRAAHIRSAVNAWQDDNGAACPTLSQLVYDHHLSEDDAQDDPWGERYKIRCEGEQVTVESPGPDGRKGTPDDFELRSQA